MSGTGPVPDVTIIPFSSIAVEAVTAVISPCVSALTVTAPVAPLIVTLVPATILVTPELAKVIFPELLVVVIPVPPSNINVDPLVIFCVAELSEAIQ